MTLACSTGEEKELFCGTCLCREKSSFSSAVEQASVIQTRHDAKECVEPGHTLGRALRALCAKRRQSYINDAGKAAKSFTARSRRAISLRYDVPMRNQARCGAVRKRSNLLRGCRNLESRHFVMDLQRGRRNQQSQDPNCALMGVAPIRDLEHGAFRVASNDRELFP